MLLSGTSVPLLLLDQIEEPFESVKGNDVVNLILSYLRASVLSANEPYVFCFVCSRIQDGRSSAGGRKRHQKE